MNKEEVCSYLDELGIAYERIDHPACYTVEEMDRLTLPHPEAGAKNLFLCDEKKRDYYLLTCQEHKRVSLNDFRRAYGLRRLRFAPEEDLATMLGLIPGAVTPFGLLNDEERRVTFFLDDDFAQHGALIGVHPNENTATVYLKGADLGQIIRNHGTTVNLVRI